MTAVPTLDEIVRDPSRIGALPPVAIRDLATKCVVALAVLQSARQDDASRPTDSRLLNARQLASKLGVSTTWIESRIDDLPDRIDLYGSPRWREADIDRWIKTRPAYVKRSLRGVK